MRFSTKIGLSVTIAALVIGPLLGAMVFFNARSLLLERIVHEQGELATGEVKKIDHVLRMTADEISVIVADNFLRDYLESPAEYQKQTGTVAGELKERAKLTGPWDGMIVFDLLGRIAFTPLKAQGCINALAESPLTRIAFDSARQGKTFRSDRIVCHRTGRNGVIFAEPIRSRGDTNKVVGVVVAQLLWTPIQNILDNVDSAATIHLFNSKGEMIGKRSTDHLDDDSEQFLLANSTQKTTQEGVPYAVVADSSHGGKNWLVVNSRPGIEGWTLMIEEPLSVMFAPIRVLARNTGILVFGMFLVTGGSLAILVRRFTRPLAELVKGVQQVEEGHFDKKVMVHSKDEFDELGNSFNSMVDKLKETRDELVRKEKLAMLGQVAGSIGHELRNPLGVMSNAVYYLQTVLNEGDENVKEYLGIILSEIAQSELIVNELVDAVHTRSPERATYEVGELIDQILKQCAVSTSVTVTLDIPETIPPLRVDALQMQQVLRNLINNSLEAMLDGGRLIIRASENRQEGKVIINVQDSGHGMPPEVLDHLFQPLYTTKSRGIGLGLLVAKNLVEGNGGRIEVESEPGEGSIFSIILPGYHKEGNLNG